MDAQLETDIVVRPVRDVDAEALGRVHATCWHETYDHLISEAALERVSPKRLAELWTQARPELTDVFQYCTGFDTVDGPEAFAVWIRKCQIETVMPFNDYWITPPPFPSLSLGGLAWEVGLATVVVLAAFLIPNAIWLHWNAWLVGLAGLLLGLALGVWSALRSVQKAAARPFPTAPNSDLKSVLKGLYLQRHFTEFAIANQGADPAALHANFGAFLAAHQPMQPTPTQPPGVIG